MSVNQFSAAQGIMTEDSYIDNLDRAIELMWVRRDEFKSILAPFFDAQDTESISTKVSSVGSTTELPRENNDTEELPYTQPAPGRNMVFTLIAYRLAIQVTDTMIRSDRFAKTVQMTSGLVISADRRLEYLRAGIINGAFASTLGADGAYLIHDSHPQLNPQATAWDNEGSGALTGSNLQALCLLAANMTDEMGYPSMREITKLLVSTAQRQTALELTTATLTAENSLNTPTVIISGLPVVVSPNLSSITAYFGFADAVGEEKGLLEFYLMRPSLANVGDNPVDIPIRKRVKMICKLGAYEGKNIFGSLGT